MYSLANKLLSAPSENTWIARLLEQAISAIRHQPDLVITFAMLEAWGLPEEIVDALNALLRDTLLGIATAQTDAKASQATETAISLTLALLAAKRDGSIKRDDTRLLRQALSTFAVAPRLKTSVEDILDKF
jgi:hypothetical protein